MEKGYVLFVVSKKNYKPYYLQFMESSCVLKNDVKDATVYPIYEAAVAVLNAIKGNDEYLYIKIFNVDGTPCVDIEEPAHRYLRKENNDDNFF